MPKEISVLATMMLTVRLITLTVAVSCRFGLACAELINMREKGVGMFRVVGVLGVMLLLAGCGAIQPVTHAQTDGSLCSLYGFAKGQHKDRVYAEIQRRELIPDQYWEDVNAGKLTVGMPVCAIRAAIAHTSSGGGSVSDRPFSVLEAGAFGRPSSDRLYAPYRKSAYDLPRFTYIPSLGGVDKLDLVRMDGVNLPVK